MGQKWARFVCLSNRKLPETPGFLDEAAVVQRQAGVGRDGQGKRVCTPFYPFRSAFWRLCDFCVERLAGTSDFCKKDHL